MSGLGDPGKTPLLLSSPDPATVEEPTEIALPYSGELIRLADAPACARAHAEVTRLQAQLAQAKKALAAALVEESRRQGTKTLRFPGATARVKTAKDIVWDLEVLERLRERGLPEARWNDLVAETVTYKVSAQVAKEIAGANEDYAEIIRLAREDVERDPTVEVARA